ncbi:membrane protein insertion efficiency factor YidD [Francisella adeliensis]|uniref:Putative membrane protein insertion efficiency factor n=1 Tax=Francisella adeliensis TaxID=2007306 RepID=A0A2Z4XWP6_9GAMM|nr:membrane protein insertion efficiency factor YidD [Francisella adeliensis]MBK2085988.1 membrane protein insertion efficiency factor YidD [Francisella adeliensis]MBK2096848.1 membrane protein insertion efficiency factor YidD [Francisella adeliensis]QIW11349.1 membrane protein insertion efficiency factor YidD [Francisella adeliensis]QIW13224.1 membrane protein insertion efficiency factor YidD [Francisella adeliensis]
MAINTKISTIFKKVTIFPFILFIKFYRYCISPFIPARCRYYPTCSEYALEALKSHGILKGLYLSVCRILRCQPLSKRDYYDPVPSKIKGLK